MLNNPTQQGTGYKPQQDDPNKQGQNRPGQGQSSGQSSGEKKNDPANPNRDKNRGQTNPSGQNLPKEDDEAMETDIGREENEGGNPSKGSGAPK